MSGSAKNDGSNGLTQEISEAELSERRDQLNRKLETQRVAERAEREAKKSSSTGYGQAMKLSSEFIAGVLVGGGLGWFCDQWLGTSPFGLMVFLLLGFAAGVLNVMRATGSVAQQDAKISRNKSDQPDRAKQR